MKLKKIILSSFVALSLVACGSGDDQSKPDDNKNTIPPKNQACIDAGDKCKWDGKDWIIDKPGKNDGDKPTDEPPAADSTFDYSDIGVTDKLEPEKKGFGFYHKGPKSPLDAKWFKNGVTLSPNIPWSSTLEYDPDLYNFVAIRLSDGSKKVEKNPVKFMFDRIGIENQQANKNIQFFGNGAHDKTDAGNIGRSSINSIDKAVEYKWNVIPAVVNTFMFRNNEGKLVFKWGDDDHKLFMNQEEEAASKQSGTSPDKTNIGNGGVKLRVYGHNAFLNNDDSAKASAETDYLDPSTLAAGKKTSPTDPGIGTYKLETRKTPTFNHVNFVWYDLSNFTKRKQKSDFTYEFDAKTNKHIVNYKLAIENYASQKVNDYKGRLRFPTDVEFGVLDNVQFGRLTGEGIDPESEDLPDYKKENLKEYPFTLGGAATAGNPTAEDWYFARGTKATSVGVLDAYKQSGEKIAYDGQAVMFGLDYKPTKALKKEDDKGDQSTNSVKPADAGSTFGKILLDGKQNFVRMVWDPASGEIKGRVFGVWTLATYWRKPEAKGGEKVYLLGQYDSSAKTLAADNAGKIDSLDEAKAIAVTSGFKKDPHSISSLPDSTASTFGQALVDVKDVKTAQYIAQSAYSLEPYTVNLVSLVGKVTEGTNSFGGVATRCKDGSKGLFTGGFFGDKAHEIGGVINSQTGSMKDENLVDPGQKWGGAFGAKYNGKPVDEDLIFTDPDINYGTSTEFFN